MSTTFTPYTVRTEAGGTVTVLCPQGAKCNWASPQPGDGLPTPGFKCGSCKRRVCYCFGCSGCCADVCDDCWALIHLDGRECTGTQAANRYSSEIGMEACSNV